MMDDILRRRLTFWCNFLAVLAAIASAGAVVLLVIAWTVTALWGRL